MRAVPFHPWAGKARAVLAYAGGLLNNKLRTYGRCRMSWRGTAEESDVFKAAGIAAAQLRCSSELGLTRLSERSEELRRSVPDTARLVIAGVVRFDD